LLLTTVGASGNDSVLALFHRRDLHAEAQIAACGCEFCLQIGSVERDRALEEVRRDPSELAAVRSEDRTAGCRDAPSRYRLANAETIERPHRIREESDSGANRVNGGARSNTTASLSVRRRAIAALSPAIPAPTTITRTG
jgi:hypothetical protein